MFCIDQFSVCGVDSTIPLKEGESSVVYCVKPSQLSIEEKTAIYCVLETNMRAMYEKTWGWNKDEKLRELFHPESRLIIVTKRSETTETSAVSTKFTDLICGFIAFRFTWDDEDEPEYPVVYVYELQIAEAYRRLNIGQRLMQICAAIGRYWSVQKLVSALE